MKTLQLTVAFPVSFELNVPMDLYDRAKSGDEQATSEIRKIVEEKSKQFLDLNDLYPVVARCAELESIQD